MTRSVRVTFEEDVWTEMRTLAPASIQDPEVVRFYVSIGLVFMQSGMPTRSDAPQLPEEMGLEQDDESESTDDEIESEDSDEE